ncbi:MAG: DUF4142 domain-containing protein [Bacteroidota bacterium]
MKKITKLAFFACTAAGLFFTSCSSHNEEKSEGEVTNDIAKDVNKDMLEGQKQTDAKHIVEIYGGSMCEVALGEQAAAKASTKSVKDVANMMVTDHKEMNQKIRDLAANEQITLQTDISDDAKNEIADLGKKTGKDYDKEFIDKAIKKHKDAISTAEDLAENGYNDQIKSFFAGALPALKHHLAMAEEAKAMLDK